MLPYNDIQIIIHCPVLKLLPIQIIPKCVVGRVVEKKMIIFQNNCQVTTKVILYEWQSMLTDLNSLGWFLLPPSLF